MYNLILCNPNASDTCISDEILQAMSNTDEAYFQINLNFQEVDLETGQIYDLVSNYYLGLTPTSNALLSPYIQLRITKATVTIDDGFIFSNFRSFDIVKNVEMLVSYNTYGTYRPNMIVSLNHFYHDIKIRYVKITEVFASLSSIVSSTILIGIIFSVINE